MKWKKRFFQLKLIRFFIPFDTVVTMFFLLRWFSFFWQCHIQVELAVFTSNALMAAWVYDGIAALLLLYLFSWKFFWLGHHIRPDMKIGQYTEHIQKFQVTISSQMKSMLIWAYEVHMLDLTWCGLVWPIFISENTKNYIWTRTGHIRSCQARYRHIKYVYGHITYY